MRLKYYLRGLGIGIVVTAIVFTVSGNHNAEMTDAQIIERAKELGMQEAEKESGLLLDKDEEVLDSAELETVDEEATEPAELETAGEEFAENAESEIVGEEFTENAESEIVGEDVSESEESEIVDEEAAEIVETETVDEEAAETVVPEAESEAVTETEIADTEQMIVITIVGGDNSVTVSQRVAEAGLVESAAAYDRFLCQNGYDKKLAVGVHEIPTGATEEEIAIILTTRKK